ncbi:MAG TPA: S41 family peptidase [Candidatus Paceibacterota bacterium]|nr:S41 family peptidase [Candidatus Paceibacterota bacterium]
MKKFLPIVIIASLVIGFGGGFEFSQFHQSKAASVQALINQDTGNVQNVDFSEFWKAWNILENKYVDKSKLDLQKMVYSAISGMVNSLGDPYTVFFEPETSQKFQEQISGSFGGVGIELDEKDGVLVVVAPIKDSPAQKAGIVTGDKIIKVDGKDTAGMAVDEAVNTIRGKIGTKVTLTILSADGKSRDVTITRDAIKVPAVDWKMIDYNGKHIAYLQLYSFSENIDSEFKAAADEILKSNTDGLIVDVRGNPGGLLDSAINLAGWFVDNGHLVVSEVFGNGTRNDFKADGKSQLKKYPTVMLVNGGSASASEILAGALHDDQHIRLIGEKTFGKGSVQELENFDNGASLKVTIAKWYTPAGVNISAQGIEPDIKVELTDDQKKDFVPGDPDKDPQLKRALDTLR